MPLAASIPEAEEVVAADLHYCTPAQRALFDRVRVPFYAALLHDAQEDKEPPFVVVAQFENEVMYWEHIEEGFNISPLTSDGRILKHWCNQDSLGEALRWWESS